ncbi:MAG: hypothetical protein H7Y27_04650 [Gemmatimonadaceae bacterium]|nr:hypothetical protein [Chitinophagaceae bacterium]
MPQSSIAKAGILAIILVVIGFAAWEFYLRSKGIGIAYDDGPELWAAKRELADVPMDQATILIGSSRNKFDIDIATWEKLTGEKAIQLAVEGSSPLPMLDELAADPKFKGKVLLDVTEGLFFALAPPAFSQPNKMLKYYKERTPAQRASFAVNTVVESQLAFLDKEFFSLNAMIKESWVKNRPGVFMLPCSFPLDFKRVNFDRQCIMTKKFETDTSLRNYVKGIWYYYGTLDRMGPLKGPKLDSIFKTVQTAIAKIKGRGGKVVFVRSPSSGPYRAAEAAGYPRNAYWNRLLTSTGCQGIHFEDYPAIANFDCPEFSHLKQSDAIIYTENIVKILHDKGWTFPKENSKSL